MHLITYSYTELGRMAPKKNKAQQYSNESLETALRLIREKQISKRQASIKYGIPRTTLIDKIKGKYRPGKGKGRDPFLSEEEELSLVK